MGHPLSTRLGVRRHRPLACAALACAAVTAHADGLVLHASPDPLRAPIEALAHAHAPATTAIHPLGDYYFFDSEVGVGGLRASTGVAGLGQPMSLYDSLPDAAQSLPYLGLGYSHLWLNSQLSLNADFGLASQNAGAVGHFRGLLNGSQSLDDVTRDLRWSPVMAVNVSYSF